MPSRTPVSASYDPVLVGGLFSGEFFFNDHVGIQGEFGEHEFGVQCCGRIASAPKATTIGFLTLGGGIVLRYPKNKTTVFFHALGQLRPDRWALL